MLVKSSASGRRRASHSMEAVISEAIALLDEAGESALTFRALAKRLGGGVASIYWYVSNKDELLDRASDHVLAAVLVDTQHYVGGEDPIADMRGIAVTLFNAIVDRPWLASYYMRDTKLQPNALSLYERIGQSVLRLGFAPRDSFHAVSAIVGFVIGIAADLGQKPPPSVASGAVTREQYMTEYAQSWRELDPEEYPFVHYIVDEFVGHDDIEQFLAGLELLFAGLKSQALKKST